MLRWMSVIQTTVTAPELPLRGEPALICVGQPSPTYLFIGANMSASGGARLTWQAGSGLMEPLGFASIDLPIV